MSNSSPIFIVGHMHSGTTLLQRMLGRHPEVYTVTGETRFFMDLALIRAHFAPLTDPGVRRAYLEHLLEIFCTGHGQLVYQRKERPVFWALDHGWTEEKLVLLEEEIAGKDATHEAIYRALFDHLAARAGKQRWLEKLAAYVGQVGQVLQAVPEARFIELVRDPRDILTSKTRRQHRGEGYDPLWDGFSWRSSVRAGHAARRAFPDRLMRLTYERLVTSPEAATREVCDFLDLAWQPGLLEVGWVNTTTEGAADSSTGPGSAAVGRWRGALPKADVLLCQWAAGREMRAAGYPLEAGRPATRLRALLLFPRSGVEFFARLVTRWKQGGWRALQGVLSRYASMVKPGSNRKDA